MTAKLLSEFPGIDTLTLYTIPLIILLYLGMFYELNFNM
jgi:hypothetical protein